MHACMLICMLYGSYYQFKICCTGDGEREKKNFLHRINKSQLLNTAISGFPCSVCVRVPVCCVNLIGFSQQCFLYDFGKKC